MNQNFWIRAVFFLLLLSLSASTFLHQKNKSLATEAQKAKAMLDELQTQNQNLSKSFEKIQKEKNTLEDALAALRKENESLQLELQKIELRITGTDEEKTYLEEMLIHKTKEIERIKSAQSGKGLSEESLKKFKEKEEEVKHLNEQTKILSVKLEKLYKTMQEHMAQINAAKIALEETIADARKKVEEQWNTVDLGQISFGEEKPQPKKDPTRTQAKKEGQVLATNPEHGFVVVDLGKIDQIKPETQLHVKKNGQSIATLTVLEVRDAMTACNIKDLQKGNKIEVGDAVAILR